MAGDVDRGVRFMRALSRHSWRSKVVIAVLLDQLVALGRVQVLAHHLGDQFVRS